MMSLNGYNTFDYTSQIKIGAAQQLLRRRKYEAQRSACWLRF